MKIAMIILLAAFALLLITQAFTMRSTAKTERRRFNVVSKDSNFEIRYYPAAVMATVQLPGRTYREVANSGFRKLASYIFGGNDAGKGISMTAPVQMSINDTASSMSFVMPSAMTLESLPRPNDKNVQLNTSPSEYVAVLGFGGYTSDSKIKKYEEELENKLDRMGIKHSDNFRVLGYNPPFQFFGRRNEIIVTIEHL